MILGPAIAPTALLVRAVGGTPGGGGGGGGGDTLLLDETGLGSAAGAWSVARKLRADYSGSAIRVREDGGDTETDIGFDVNGDLDTATMETHCGPNNGFIVTIYDQSGNTRPLTIATTTKQPQIVGSGSTIVNAGGIPYADFNGTGHVMQAATWTQIQPVSIAIVFEPQTYSNGDTIYDGTSTNSLRFYMPSTTATFRMLATAGTTDLTGATATELALMTNVWNGTASTSRLNAGTEQVSSTTGAGAPGGFTLGARTSTPNDPAEFDFFEAVMWPSVLSSEVQTTMRSNINAYYSIF